MNKLIVAILSPLVPVESRPAIWRTLRAIRFFGFKKRCSLCGSRLRKFLPHGAGFAVLEEKHVVGGMRRDSLCPVCESYDRERLLHLYLIRKTDLQTGRRRLLHIAPEKNVRKFLSRQPNLDYITGDLFATDVMVKADVTNLDFPDGSFDAIICNHVLEHIPDDRKAMSEIRRVLKPGGYAILQVPISATLKATYEDPAMVAQTQREQAFGQGDHVRIYARDYRERLTGVGLKVEMFDWTREQDKFGGPLNPFGLDPEERVYVAIKE